MTSNPTNPKVSSGSVPRARAAPQPTTGMTDNQQRQTGSPSRAQFDDQARTAATDLGGTSQPGRDIPLSCPGCGGKPGIGTRFSLSGTENNLCMQP